MASIQTTPRTVFELDGSLVLPAAMAGLGFDADIAITNLGGQVQRKKSVANVRVSPGQMRVGLGMGRGLYKWIKASMDQGIAPKSGVVKTLDFNYRVFSVLNFYDALITAFSVPQLDGSSREAGFFDVAFNAERVVRSKGDGSDIRGQLEPQGKAWVSSNFKIAIGNLPCARVASVDAFTWRCALPSAGAQPAHEPFRQMGEVTVPNLKLHISMADYGPWLDAATRWFVDGRRLESDEMRGRITLLGPNMVDEVAAIELYNVGFKSFAYEDGLSQASDVQRFAVELYVERMALSIAAYAA